MRRARHLLDKLCTFGDRLAHITGYKQSTDASSDAPMAVLMEIVRFIDDHQPGFVEVRLVDAHNKAHLFIEKVPVICTEDLSWDSEYPRPVEIECEIEATWTDDQGHRLVRVSTERPWGVESTEGEKRFEVLSPQVVRRLGMR